MRDASEQAPAAPEEEDEEELEDVPPAEKEVDPLRNARIRRIVDGKDFIGEVEDIECGKITKERLYRIKYSDGDLEHMTEKQVRELLVSFAEEPKADAMVTDGTVDGEAKARGEAGEEEAGEEELVKRPAAKAKAKGKAKGKGKAKALARKPAAYKPMVKRPAGK